MIPPVSVCLSLECAAPHVGDYRVGRCGGRFGSLVDGGDCVSEAPVPQIEPTASHDALGDGSRNLAYRRKELQMKSKAPDISNLIIDWSSLPCCSSARSSAPGEPPAWLLFRSYRSGYTTARVILSAVAHR
jgi:hypothetical protein